MYKIKKIYSYLGAILCIALFFSCSSVVKSEFNPEDLQVINQTINDARITYNVNEGSDPSDYPIEEKLPKNNKINEFLNINIVSTSNIHGNVFETNSNIDISMLSSFISSLKQKDNNAVLLLDSGDFLYGNDYSNTYCGENVANVLGYMGYDALTFGFSDLNYGLKQFDRNLLILAARSVALLSNNIRIGSKRVLPSHKIFDFLGFKIAVVGLSNILSRESSFEFNTGATSFTENIIENLKKEIESIKGKADYIILLSSNPIYNDNNGLYSQITSNIDSIDLIIAKDNRINNNTPLELNGVKIYGSNQSFNNVYLTTLKINENKEIIENVTHCLTSTDINFPSESEFIKSLELTDISKDNNILLYNKEKKEKAESSLSSYVATIKNNIALNENWTAEAILNSILNYTRSDVVLYPQNDIKDFIKNRNVKLSDIYSISSNNSDIVEILLNSSEIKTLINESFKNSTEENNTSLITNLRIEWDIENKEGDDEKTIQTVKDLSLATRKLSEDNNIYYKVALPYSVLNQFNIDKRDYKIGIKTNLILANYLKERYPFDSTFIEETQNIQEQNQTAIKNDEEKSVKDMKDIQQNFNNPAVQNDSSNSTQEYVNATNTTSESDNNTTDEVIQNEITQINE